MEIRIGYARCPTRGLDFEPKGNALLALGVTEDQTYTDHGLRGTSRDRPTSDKRLPPSA